MVASACMSLALDRMVLTCVGGLLSGGAAWAGFESRRRHAGVYEPSETTIFF